MDKKKHVWPDPGLSLEDLEFSERGREGAPGSGVLFAAIICIASAPVWIGVGIAIGYLTWGF